MNTFKWLFPSTTANHEQLSGDDSNEFDYSLLVPITVGLTSVVAGVVLGRRRCEYFSNLTGSRHSSNSAVDDVSATVSKSDTSKRKTRNKANAAKRDHVVEIVKQPISAPITLSTVPPTTASIKSDVVQYPAGQQANSMISSISTSNSQKPLNMHIPPPVLTDQGCEGVGQLTVPSIAPSSPPVSLPSTKPKSKKSKRATSKRHPSPTLIPTHFVADFEDEESTEQAWVTVESKKAKQTSDAVDVGSSKKKKSKSKRKATSGTDASDAPHSSDVHSLTDSHAQSKVDEECGSDPSAAVRGTVSPVVKHIESSNRPRATVHPVIETSSRPVFERVDHSLPPTAAKVDASASSSPTSPQDRLVTAYEGLLRRSLGAEAVLDIRNLLGVNDLSPPSHSTVAVSKPEPDTATPSKTTKLLSSSRMPATSELLTEHLTAQVQAKEAECQILRSEVISLREEVNSIKHASSNQSPSATEHSTSSRPSVETTTSDLPLLENDSRRAPSAVSEKSQQSSSEAAAQDAVLVQTLQDEIARLAKVVSRQRQRNEHLESLNTTANKELSNIKARLSSETESWHSEMDIYKNDLRVALDSKADLEFDLQEALQKAEMLRRKSEEGENASTRHIKELEKIRVEHQSVIAKCEELQVQVARLQGEQERLIQERQQLLHASEQNDTKQQQQVVDLRSRLEETEAELRARKMELDSLSLEAENQRAQLQVQLNDAVSGQRTAQEKLSEVQAEVTRLTGELSEACAKLNEHGNLSESKKSSTDLLYRAERELTQLKEEHDALKRESELAVNELKSQLTAVCEREQAAEDRLDMLHSESAKTNDELERLRAQLRERDNSATEHGSSMDELRAVHQKQLTKFANRTEQLESQLLSVELERDTVSSARAELQSKLDSTCAQEQQLQSKLFDTESEVARLTQQLSQLLSASKTRDDELSELRTKCTMFENQAVQEIIEIQSVPKEESLVVNQISVGSGSASIEENPFFMEPRASLDTTTQTDAEPSTEFDSVLVAETADEATKDHSELAEQVHRYKSALDMTETMLAKLQSSVDAEEDRWRRALDASRAECELLEAKVNKLETALSDLAGERDSLTKVLEQFRKERKSVSELINLDCQSLDERQSSTHSLSTARLADMFPLDENASKPELLASMKKLRCLVQVEHEALKREQCHAAQLQHQLEKNHGGRINGNSDHVTGCSNNYNSSIDDCPSASNGSLNGQNSESNLDEQNGELADKSISVTAIADDTDDLTQNGLIHASSSGVQVNGCED